MSDAPPARWRHDGRMERMRFAATALPGPRGTVVVPVPADPDLLWSRKTTHAVKGTINGHVVRGRLTRSDDGWAFAVPAMWARDCNVASGTTVEVDLGPEGPQRQALAP